MAEQGSGPSKAGYLVGGGILLLGVVGAIVWFALGFMGFSNSIDDFQRVPANGQGVITLSGTGGYIIYYEAPGADEGEIPDGRVLLTAEGSDGGDAVTLETYGTSLTYNDGDHVGRAVLTFEIDRPGSYLLESESDGDGELAVGRSVAGNLVKTIVGAMALGALGVLVGATVLIVTAVRRRNARSRSRGGYPPPQPGYPPAPPGYPPPPPPPAY